MSFKNRIETHNNHLNDLDVYRNISKNYRNMLAVIGQKGIRVRVDQKNYRA